MKPVDPSRLSLLVLDYSRPKELLQVLQSIKRHVKCDHEVVVHSNGGHQGHCIQYYDTGLCDRLILNKLNNGAGRGCVDLFNYCLTDYAIYLEGDQPLIRDVTEEEWRRWAKALEVGTAAPVASMVGRVTHGNFSQRAFFAHVPSYRELARSMPNGGPGTDRKHDTNEYWMQQHILENGLILFAPPAVVIDMGLWSVNENADGSVWLHETDRRGLWLIRGPVKEKAAYPSLSDAEWAQLLDYQVWPDGTIPEKDRAHSFIYWKERNHAEVVAELRKSYCA